MPIKLLTIIGARPQFIKAATVSRCLRKERYKDFQEIIVHTGQHYSFGLSEVFFKELDIPKPAYNLEAGSGTHAVQTSAMMMKLEDVIALEKPDWVMIYGDTNSTLAGAIVAAKASVRLAHIEAGLRSYRRGMAEEINRVIADRLSDLLFAPTDESVLNLAHEGITKNVHQVGDVMYDSFLYLTEKIDYVGLTQKYGVVPEAYGLATIHRAENTDHVEKLKIIFEGLGKTARQIKLIMPLHPRTQKVIEVEQLPLSKNITIIEPLPYFDMIGLIQKSAVVITDSGGMQKEAYFASVPCVTIREETEWKETLTNGWNRLAPPFHLGSEGIADTVQSAIHFSRSTKQEAYYGDGNAGQKILEVLKSII